MILIDYSIRIDLEGGRNYVIPFNSTEERDKAFERLEEKLKISLVL